MLLARHLAKIVRNGRLALIDHLGREHRFGGNGGPDVVFRLTDARTMRDIGLDPDLKFGEAYTDGHLIVERGDLIDLLEIMARNAGLVAGDHLFLPRLLKWTRFMRRRIDQWNPVGRSRRNVAHHYDLSGALYDLFLDADRQYSCAYFSKPGMTLEEAQDAKKRHIAAKLLLAPGQKVLDIGSGWGGLGMHLALASGADVTGVTLSAEQHKVSNARAQAAGLGDRVRFDLRDYRELEGRFDRVVSVGMFEHVGVNHFGRFFGRVRDLMAEDGVALIHSIGRSGPPGVTSPWIAKYIFPGGYIPALSEVLPAVERAGLIATDVEILRLHYAETLKHWRARVLANWQAIAALYDERFCRMWNFYLAGSEAAFRWGGLMVFQIQIARRADVIPITRDYMAEAENAVSDAPSGRRPPIAA